MATNRFISLNPGQVRIGKITETSTGTPTDRVELRMMTNLGASASFSDATKTATTTTGSAALTALSANVITAGWKVGMSISGTGIPGSTTILAISADGLTVLMSANATATATLVAVTASASVGTATNLTRSEIIKMFAVFEAYLVRGGNTEFNNQSGGGLPQPAPPPSMV